MLKNATKKTTSIMGVIAGVVGIEHGIGELLQGNAPPQGIVFPSWPNSPFFESLAGEPALSLIPNFLISGIISIVLSAIIITWSSARLQHQNGGWVLTGLSILLLLVGGGFGPPLLGIIIGLSATRIWTLKQTKQRIHLNRRIIIIQQSWAYLFCTNLLLWLFLFPVIPLLGYFLKIESETLVPYASFLAFVFLGLSIISAYVHDTEFLAKLSPTQTENQTQTKTVHFS